MQKLGKANKEGEKEIPPKKSGGLSLHLVKREKRESKTSCTSMGLRGDQEGGQKLWPFSYS